MTKLVVEKSYFIFNILYKQKGSVEMNLPIGPTLANVFPCFFCEEMARAVAS